MAESCRRDAARKSEGRFVASRFGARVRSFSRSGKAKILIALRQGRGIASAKMDLYSLIVWT